MADSAPQQGSESQRGSTIQADPARERILAACEHTIAARGLGGFRMQQVANEAGVSIGLLAYHFGGREGLLQAALDRVNSGTVARARTHSGATAVARLRALLTSEFGDGPTIRDGSIVWNELRAHAVFERTQAAALTSSTQRWEARVAALVSEAAPNLDAAASALALTSLVEGLSGRWLTGQITAEEAQRSVLATLDALGLS